MELYRRNPSPHIAGLPGCLLDEHLTRKVAPWPNQCAPPDEFFVRPDDVAATAAFLVGQPRSAWTFELEARPFELEARPFGETW